ncbi:imidazole glycerol phosphate synthase subunit HisH [Lachnospiraceae bacterium 47-T17]
MIAVINYGLSNLLSIKRAVDLYTDEADIINDPDRLKKADKIILPGVGSFHYGMDCLNLLGLKNMLIQKALEETPILGICLGMQMLFDEGDEGGTCEGLKLIPGRIEKIPDADINGEMQDVPHIGWEKLLLNEDAAGMDQNTKDILEEQEFYFVHSYEAKPEHTGHRLADIVYGGRTLCAIAKRGNIMGCQFHPEKSGPAGLKLLQNFICGL